MKEDKVSTAGSCFAQHIARYLSKSGFHFYVTEPPHPILTSDQSFKFNYGVFSARYGNVYTVRQLVQLVHRAYGVFKPQDKVWRGEDGCFVDPFRPQIQPGGWSDEYELLHDRELHLQAIRKIIENSDVFIFTLGLTEAWLSKYDNAVFPLCPGVAGGVYDENKYFFHNFNVFEVINDLNEFIYLLRTKNKNCKVILTVSPVPLAATAEIKQHVLTSTIYSKSVLRVACEEVVKKHKMVCYFPSYEIISGAFNRGGYYDNDLRGVLEIGVQHVMRVFMKHFVDLSGGNCDDFEDKIKSSVMQSQINDTNEMKRIVQVNCDEERLSNL
jgi:hypothetical protein